MSMGPGHFDTLEFEYEDNKIKIFINYGKVGTTMKRKIINIGLIIIISIITLGICTGCKNNETYNDYCKLTYSTSYNSYSLVLKNGNYEVVTDKISLDEILNEISDKEQSEKFDEKFFEDKNLLVVSGGVSSGVNTFNVTESKVDIKIYCASPLVSDEDILSYDIYLIPISKDVKDINVETTTYTDRAY